jgi:hypothetical protein
MTELKLATIENWVTRAIPLAGPSPENRWRLAMAKANLVRTSPNATLPRSPE